jgi:hypothetical protein
MITYKYMVYNTTSSSIQSDPAVFRSIYGIDNAGHEYIGCVSTIVSSLEFYKYNLEVAMNKVSKLTYDLEQANNRIQELTNGSNQVEA